jgi:small-conductance mechanosensitive channel
MPMDALSRRLLIGPMILAGIGFMLFATASALGDFLSLSSDGIAVLLLHHISGVWMFLALAWLAARSCDVLLVRLALLSRDGTPYPRLLSDLLRAALFAVAATMILLVVFGQPVAGLVTVSSVVIAVIGFALRNVISDLFSGIALGIDHPYRIGDWIETVQGSAGKVSEITWRTTRLTDRNGFVIVVPNGLVAGQRLINYGDGERDYRTALRVPLDPAIPAPRAKRILLSGALAAARRIGGLSPDVLVADYVDGAAIYLVRFRVPDFGREAACRDDVAACVLNALQCAGETIERTGLSDATERADLATRMRSRDCAAGEVVVRQGDPGDFLYVLGEGLLDVEIVREDATTIRDRIGPGEVFGEISLLTGEPRGATVTAAFDSVVYEIHRQDLDPILQARPEIAEGLATVMAAHQAHNERYDMAQGQAAVPTRDDLLARLRQLFRREGRSP